MLRVLESRVPGVVKLSMASQPVNAMSSVSMEELCIKAATLAADDSVKGVILCSGLERGVFSAGLNLAELIVPHDSRGPTKELRQFISHVGSVTRAWLAFPKPMVAAINGSAPAGGCLLSLTADYRVMADDPKFVIGLNETQVGVRAPWYLCQMLTDAVGVRRGERMLQLGELVGPAEALSMGLVDELAGSREACVEAAEAAAERFVSIPEPARRDTKAAMRSKLVEDMEDRASIDTEEFADYCAQQHVQERLRAVVESLARR
jgi:3,2-trans-enoyl-CoA isomerase